LFCAYNCCAFHEDDPKRDETWSCNILIVKLYLHFVGFVLYNDQSNTNNSDIKLKLKILILSTDYYLISH